MAGITPNQGESFMADVFYNRRDAAYRGTLIIGLFTNNITPVDTTTLASITQPNADGGYATQTLSAFSIGADSADGTAGVVTHAAVNFSAVTLPFNVPVYGYFIATAGATGGDKLIHIERDVAGPITVTAGSTYRVNLNLTIA